MPVRAIARISFRVVGRSTTTTIWIWMVQTALPQNPICSRLGEHGLNSYVCYLELFVEAGDGEGAVINVQ